MTPVSVCLRRWSCYTVLLVMLLTAACAMPFSSGATPTVARPSPTSALAGQTVYWNQNDWLTALRASDGRVRWQAGHQWANLADGTGSFSYGPSTTTLSGDTLYSLGINARLSAAVYASAVSDGTIRWQVPVTGCLTEPVNVPLVADGVVYVALTGHYSGFISCEQIGWVYALQKSDGRVLWRVPFDRVVFSTLALTNGVLVVANSSYPANPEVFTLTGLRASDGKQLWHISNTRTLSAFTAGDGMVITSGHADARFASGIRVEALRARDGAQLWDSVIIDNESNDATAPVLANGLVYVGNSAGSLFALRAIDGKVNWRFPFSTHNGALGGLLAVNHRLYLGVGPDLDVLDADNGTLLQAFAVFTERIASARPEYVWSAPVVTDNAIFVSAGVYDCLSGFLCHPDELNGKLYALDIITGKMLWQYQTQQGYTVSAPVLGT